MRLALILIAAALIAAAVPGRAAEPLVADLSHHLVAITTGFAGTRVLLFGAVEDLPGGADLVVVVRGPPTDHVVRRRGRRVGLWVTVGEAHVVDAPSFYHLAATRPLAQIAAPEILARYHIGLDRLDLKVRTVDANADAESYRAALIRLKQRRGLYGVTIGDIGFLSRRLFRTEVTFPGNVPVGTYRVEVYLLSQGQVAGRQVTPLVVSKIGLGARVSEFAHRHSAAYGIIAVLLAALAGWAVAVAFRKP